MMMAGSKELKCASEAMEQIRVHRFFLLLAAKVQSSCEEGPAQSALQSAL